MKQILKYNLVMKQIHKHKLVVNQNRKYKLVMKQIQEYNFLLLHDGSLSWKAMICIPSLKVVGISRS